MPHLFVDRPRLMDLTEGTRDLKAHFRWETVNALLYKLGGVIFVLGSVFYFPALVRWINLGSWAFFFGSLLYLLVTGHDMVEAIRHRTSLGTSPAIWDRLQTWAAAAYLTGTLLFTVGSVFFLSYIGLFTTGAWCFVIGSLLFVLGAAINVLQIVRATDLAVLQLLNLTAVSFVAGSVLFTVASVPYLWHLADTADTETLAAFSAWQYLIGSGLFLLGGLFNYWRAWRVIRRAMGQAGPAPRVLSGEA